MRIKIPFIEFETDKDCPCKDQSEFELKLKCMKTKLHSIYIASIATGIVIWSLATGQANTTEFSDWISFASTITSIILSVIAIILSITGESKTDAMRNQMEETAGKLEETAKAINDANVKNSENVKELKDNIEILSYKIELLQGKTDEVLNEYKKQKIGDGLIENDLNDNIKWERSKK